MSIDFMSHVDMKYEGLCKGCLIGQFSCWLVAKMKDSSLKWCLVNCANSILKWVVRDWSQITGRGGAREVLPIRKGRGGAQKVLAMLKGAQKVAAATLANQPQH